MRIEARTNQIKYILDGQLLIQTNDSTFHSGQGGIGYSFHPNGYPAGRGAYFDNFIADTLDILPPCFSDVSLQPDGKIHFLLTSHPGTTSVVDRATTLTNWVFFTNIVNTNPTVEFLDDPDSPFRFYRARRLP